MFILIIGINAASGKFYTLKQHNEGEPQKYIRMQNKTGSMETTHATNSGYINASINILKRATTRAHMGS